MMLPWDHYLARIYLLFSGYCRWPLRQLLYLFPETTNGFWLIPALKMRESWPLVLPLAAWVFLRPCSTWYTILLSNRRFFSHRETCFLHTILPKSPALGG